MLKLYIGNKNYSSWSMRPWTLMTQCGVPFEEAPVRMDSFAPGSEFKRRLAEISPAGRVPVLVDGGVRRRQRQCMRCREARQRVSAAHPHVG